MAEEDEDLCSLIETVKIAGYLEKRGKRKLRSYQPWKKYWFVLDQQLLLYYKSPNDHETLSPCRGSLNMGLVTCVQSADSQNVIHLLTRTQLVQLRASNKNSQQQWIKVLTDAIQCRKTNLEAVNETARSLRYSSLDNLPKAGEQFPGIIATLPRRNNIYSGSLDQMWRPQVKQKKFEQQLPKVADVRDENQNHMYSTVQKATLVTKIKDRIIVGKKENIDAPGIAPNGKKLRSRESFLHRIFKRSNSTVPVVDEDSNEQSTITPSAPNNNNNNNNNSSNNKSDSELEDPLYDTIDSMKEQSSVSLNVDEATKAKIGVSMMPEGTMEELKEKLRSRESLDNYEEDIENRKVMEKPSKVPPALPPRKSSRSDFTKASDESDSGQDTVAQETVVAFVHYDASAEVETDKMSLIPNVHESSETDYVEVKKPVKTAQDIATTDSRNSDDSCHSSETQEELVQLYEKVVKKMDENIENLNGTVEFIEEIKEKKEEKEEEENELENDKPVIKAMTLKSGIDKDSKITDDLDTLLEKLSKLSRIETSEDPDYDVPRPHGKYINCETPSPVATDRIPATEFFSSRADSASIQTSSLEPDSLEGKKESVVEVGLTAF